MTVRGILARLLTVAAATAGCASGDLGQASLYRGDSGPVNWEIVGLRTNISEVDGLLGTDFLQRFVLNVDGGARRLTLERRP